MTPDELKKIGDVLDSKDVPEPNYVWFYFNGKAYEFTADDVVEKDAERE